MSIAPCPHLSACDGCPRFGDGSAVPTAIERLQALATRAGIVLGDTRVGEEAGYRHRGRLAVRGSPSQPQIGLFQSGTHHIVDIPRCPIHHPLINSIAAQVKQALRETGTTPYHDVRHAGLLRYIQVVVERSSQTAQLVVVGNSDRPEPLAPFIEYLEAHAQSLHSLWYNGNSLQQNVILGQHWYHFCGPTAVVETLGGAQVFFPPAAFGQANLGLFESVLAEVHSWVEDGQRVVEYHAGVGAIGLGLSSRVRALTCVEVSQGSVEGLELGVAQLSEELQSRVEVLHGTAKDHAAAARSADVVIVDPPRKGLESALTQSLAEHPPQRLIYLSCGLASFERDAEALLAAGHLKLTRLRPYALFPFTQHIETLALFERC